MLYEYQNISFPSCEDHQQVDPALSSCYIYNPYIIYIMYFQGQKKCTSGA